MESISNRKVVVSCERERKPRNKSCCVGMYGGAKHHRGSVQFFKLLCIDRTPFTVVLIESLIHPLIYIAPRISLAYDALLSFF